jgi:hypothetical protein
MNRHSSRATFLRRLFPALVLGLLLVGGLTAQKNGNSPTKETIAALVKKLADADRVKREEASKELINLGPVALPFLPELEDIASDSQKRQLTVVLKALKDQQIQQELPLRPVTLQSSDLSLDKALTELTKQSGNKVEDRRRTKVERPLKLDLKGVTFWQALDAIAKEADAQLSLYQRDGVIALVDGPNKPLPVSYHGLFRIVLLRKVVVDDLAADAHHLIVSLEVAWEPRFRPYLLETVPQSVVAQDDAKHDLRGEDGGGKAPVEGKLAATVDVRFPAPPRSAARLGVLRGEFSVTGAGEMLTFTFGTLAQIEKDANARQQKQKDVAVKLSKPILADDLWTVEAQLEYPPHGPKFESFQSWIGYNEMFLRSPEGNQRFPNNGGYSVESSSANRAVIRYHFVDKRAEKLVRGNAADWQVAYKTPGVLVEVPVPFTFKDVALP